MTEIKVQDILDVVRKHAEIGSNGVPWCDSAERNVERLFDFRIALRDVQDALYCCSFDNLGMSEEEWAAYVAANPALFARFLLTEGCADATVTRTQLERMIILAQSVVNDYGDGYALLREVRNTFLTLPVEVK